MSLPTLDKMRTDILTKVAKCARKNEREFKVPDLYKDAARQVVRTQPFLRLADGDDLAVGGGVDVRKHPVVTAPDGRSVFDDHRPERSAVPPGDAFQRLVDRELHERVFRPDVRFVRFHSTVAMGFT